MSTDSVLQAIMALMEQPIYGAVLVWYIAAAIAALVVALWLIDLINKKDRYQLEAAAAQNDLTALRNTTNRLLMQIASSESLRLSGKLTALLNKKGGSKREEFQAVRLEMETLYLLDQIEPLRDARAYYEGNGQPTIALTIDKLVQDASNYIGGKSIKIALPELVQDCLHRAETDVVEHSTIASELNAKRADTGDIYVLTPDIAVAAKSGNEANLLDSTRAWPE